MSHNGKLRDSEKEQKGLGSVEVELEDTKKWNKLDSQIKLAKVVQNPKVHTGSALSWKNRRAIAYMEKIIRGKQVEIHCFMRHSGRSLAI